MRWLRRWAWRDEYDDALETAQAAACQLLADRDNVLEALENMVTFHLGTDDGTVDHGNLTANMYACDMLVRYRPDRWRETPGGIERNT